MNQTRIVFEKVREILVDALGVEPEEVTHDAKFFDDLGGESLDVLDLTFRCERQFGVKVPFQDLAAPNQDAKSADEASAEKSLEELHSRFPYLDFTQFDFDDPKSISSLFTVDTIVRIVENTLAQNDIAHRSIHRDGA